MLKQEMPNSPAIGKLGKHKKPSGTVHRILLFILVVTSLYACQPRTTNLLQPDWKIADLRALDPAENIPPSQDLIALYIRKSDDNLEIRLDFLDLTTPLDFDLYLELDSSDPRYPLTIHIPPSGSITAGSFSGAPVSDLRIRITRDTFMDTMVINLNLASLSLRGLPFTIQASTSSITAPSIIDQIGPVRSDAAIPKQVDVLFAFWNTFQAYTPSQALRSWNGAHTGPGRSRHGLSNLLNAAQNNDIALFLLDLKTPTNLSVLDDMGVLPGMRDMINAGEVILPDAFPYRAPNNFFNSQIVGNEFQTGNSALLYSATFPTQHATAYRVLFLPTDTLILPEDYISNSFSITPFRWQNQIIIPIPARSDLAAENSATSEGPSISLRRNLIQSALDPQTNMFLLGGELVRSAWGDPASVTPTLRYLKAHPWIRFLTQDSLLTLQPNRSISPQVVTHESTNTNAERILEILQLTPPGPVTDLAWQAFYSLLTAPTSQELATLRLGYFGIVGHLLEAALWANQPASSTHCTVDPDWDGQFECILASQTFFAIIEPDGANVVIAFSRGTDGVHQIIAPYAQFVVGLGDSSTWDLSRGSEADPSLIQGGFIDHTEYTTHATLPGQIMFTSTEGNITKSYRLSSSGLQTEYESSEPIVVQISIGLDPWRRYSPGWGDSYNETYGPQSWTWAIDSGPQVSISTNAALNQKVFTASQATMSSPEDPNMDYPAGHYIPIPLALIEVTGSNNFYIELTFSDDPTP